MSDDLAPTVQDDVAIREEERRSRRARLLDALDVVTDWVVRDDGAREDTEISKAVEMVNRVISESAVRQKIYLAAIAKRHILSIGELATDIDRIENNLRNITLDNLLPKDRIALYQALTRRQEVLIEYVKQITEAGYPQQIEDPVKQKDIDRKIEAHELDKLDVKQRDRVTRVFDRLTELRKRVKPI